MALVDRCKIFVSVQFIGWSFVHACFSYCAMADSSIRVLKHMFLESFFLPGFGFADVHGAISVQHPDLNTALMLKS